MLTFEGSEGCGKSTQIRLLTESLRASAATVEVMREPGGTAIGEEIRHLLQHSASGQSMTQETELLLFAASRAQLVREKVLPLLESGVFVILDRFLDSTTVYQGVARGLPLASVRAINAFATGSLAPNLTFLLDLDTETAWQRIQSTGRELDRMESQPRAFFETVRQGYLELARDEPERIIVIDAARTPEMVHAEILSHIDARLKLTNYSIHAI